MYDQNTIYKPVSFPVHLHWAVDAGVEEAVMAKTDWILFVCLCGRVVGLLRPAVGLVITVIADNTCTSNYSLIFFPKKIILLKHREQLQLAIKCLKLIGYCTP